MHFKDLYTIFSLYETSSFFVVAAFKLCMCVCVCRVTTTNGKAQNTENPKGEEEKRYQLYFHFISLGITWKK